MPQHLLQSLRGSLQRRPTAVDLSDRASDRGHLTRVGTCVECGARVTEHFGRRNQWIGHPGQAELGHAR